MSPAENSGTPWRDDELDAIVHDYFDMLGMDLRQLRYVKAHHRAALMRQLGRTKGSIELKHQNISAVLDEIGLPWIRGYVPMSNYQGSIVQAIERYLTAHPTALEIASQAPEPATGEVFVPPPTLQPPTAEPLPELDRLLRKFDPIERDHRNRQLGQEGERFVLHLEQQSLIAAGRADLAASVRWVAHLDGDNAGYDIRSYHPSGAFRLIEVKTTAGSARTPFFLTRNEKATADAHPADWRLYRLHDFARSPRIFTLAPPLEPALHLRPETFRASFR